MTVTIDDIDAPSLGDIEDFAPGEDCLSGRKILVTGAGDGIGRSASVHFARHGATVILLGRTVAKLESVYDEIVGQDLPKPGIFPMDLSTAGSEDYRTLGAAVAEHYDDLHGLLHNAAILGDRIPLEHYPSSTFMEVMQVNLNAAVMMTQALLPLLTSDSGANIVFTSSGVGRRPRAYWGAYAVSKGALEAYATLLADELEKTAPLNIHVLNPGPTRTAMRAAAFPAEDPATLHSPADLMPLYLYLMTRPPPF